MGNMIGSPNHVKKALDAGVDIICAQGGEGGGHTGEVATSILIPQVVDLCRGKISPLTGKQVPVVAAGGIYEGGSLAMALSLGADAVWVGTRFVASEEGGAPSSHKNAVMKAGVHDTHRCEAFSGRPLRVIKTKYSRKWVEERSDVLNERIRNGILPAEEDFRQVAKANGDERVKLLKSIGADVQMPSASNIHLCGQVAGAISEVLPARQIVDDMVLSACNMMRLNNAKVSWPQAKL